MKNSLKQKLLEEEALIRSKKIYNGTIFSLRQDTIELEGHPPHNWDIVEHPGAVAILAVKEDGHLILVQQWRRAIQQIIYEVCAGTLENGEEPLDCAEREIQEELGFKAATMIPMGGFYTAPGFCDEYIHLFLAKDLSPNKRDGDVHEAIDVVEIPLDEALELVDSGEIDDVKTLYTLLRYQRWLSGA